MRKLALLLAVVALAAAPKAAIKAPSSVAAGSLVQIDTSGTASDQAPEVLLWPGGLKDGPEFGADGSLKGWRLTGLGTQHFFVIARGMPPGSNVVVVDVATCVVEVMAAGPTVPVAPVVPASDALSSGARAYVQAIPDDFMQAAADLRAGKLKTIADINKAIADYRRSGGQALATEMNRRFAAGADANGTITDPSGIASALESIGAAQREALRP